MSPTFHFPLKAGFLFSSRARADLDWKKGVLAWRYRNKVTLERTFSIDAFHLIPYIAAEPYHTSQYAKWSTTALYAGCFLPIGKHIQFDTYYENENHTGKRPNQQKKEIGLALLIYINQRRNDLLRPLRSSSTVSKFGLEGPKGKAKNWIRPFRAEADC